MPLYLPGSSAPRLKNSPLLNVYQERYTHCADNYRALFNKFGKRYDFYRCVYRGQYAAGRNRVFIPFVFSVIETDVAKKAQVAFGQYPYMDFEGTDPKVARRNSLLVSQQLRDIKIYPKGVDYFLCADMYGFACAQLGWSTIRRKERWRELDPMDPSREIVREDTVTRFDGPQLEVMDPIDFMPQFGAREMDDALYAFRTYYRDYVQLEQEHALGKWLPGSMDALRASGGPPSTVEESYAARFNLYRSREVHDAKRNEKHAAPVKMVDMWGYVPDDVAINGVNFVLLTVANDAIVMRYKEFPFWHGDLSKVFLTYAPHRDPHYMHGVGKIEVVETLQALANKFASQKADSLDRLLDPAILVNSQTGITDETLYMKPGRVIQSDGPVDDSMIRPFIQDMRPVQLAIQEISEIFKHIQIGTGSPEDTIMGFPGGDRQTKAEFQGRTESAMNRVMMEAKLAEVCFVEPLGDGIRALNRQMLRLPKELKMLGAEGEIDSLTGFPMKPEEKPIDLADVNEDYVAQAVGSTRMIGKGARQQNIILLMQTIQANPVAAGIFNWSTFLRYTLKTFDFPHVEEFLNQQMPAVNNLAAGDGGGGMMSSMMGGQGVPQGADLVNLLGGG